MKMTTCVGCGGSFSDTDGPTHRYMESSPGCWDCFTQVLTREYSDLRYRNIHRLTVDAYAVQHPGQPSKQTVRSVALHAISLCAVFEDGLQPDKATRLIQQAAKDKDRFVWLTPPACMGNLTVSDVLQASAGREHIETVRQWAESAWNAWSEHHSIIRNWMEDSWAL